MAIKVGLQMHSVREAMHLDSLAALAECAKAGYRYIQLPARLKGDESGQLYGKSASQWKLASQQYGVILTGGYAKDLSEKNLDDYIAFYKEAGAEHIVIPIDYFPTMELLERKCELYNTMGARCKQSGLTLCYENHYHEFQQLDGRFIFDILMKNTDPELLSVSLNSYWLMRGLVNPLEVLKKYSNRVISLVQQDYPLAEIDKFNMWRFYRYHPIAYNIQYENVLQGNEIENIHPVQCELFCEIGTGILPLQPIIDLANESGNMSNVFLKQDYTRYPSEFESIRCSAKHYRRVRGVSWD